jgi:AraC-like DNA-binding protein
LTVKTRLRGATSSVRILRAVVAALAARGVDPAAFLAEVGVSPETVADSDARIPFEHLEHAWALVPRFSEDDAFGLHLAETVHPDAFDVLDYVSQSCSNLEEAFARLVRYQRLMHDVVAVTLELHGDEAWIVHRVSDDPAGVPRHAAEAAVASWILRARKLTGADLRPRLVRFQHTAPRDVSEHARILRCKVEFSAKVNTVILLRTDLSLPIVSANSGLRAILDRHAESLLASLPEQGLASAARAAIADALRAGTAELTSVAKRLGVSKRTLQRRFAHDGLRFEELLEEVRRELAVRYLSEHDVAIGEIAFLLAYSDPTAFHRAFRRWTGTTPQAYRRQRT